MEQLQDLKNEDGDYVLGDSIYDKDGNYLYSVEEKLVADKRGMNL